jgi:riboflavin biosynthesis pyrimidine reductase
MRKVVVSEFVSVDGVMEDPGGVEGFDRGGWAFEFDRGPEGDKFKRNNSTVIKGDVASEVSELKQEPGGDILVNGSARLVQTLMEHDLVDEYRLMVFPVVLGSGKRLFTDGMTRLPCGSWRQSQLESA